ncbi:SDR family NAD(P)-dependent oxidoreductase [Diplocloster modestus]|uniref:SDR family oxidoreductase n=1 Tax=Diplocloster modestus TaxID=2850322 RepID=A0ABS6K3S9_9FIRM|nr:SDR family oxidoreductase [Diplocloster modestus]MBU9725179.1 SDR family oxidoreductase [Diplocloster modestus]
MKIKDFLRKIKHFFVIERVKPICIPVVQSEMLIGKTALIIGGTGGIGFGIAKSFVRSGCKVILSGTNSDKLDMYRKKLPADQTKTITLDVLDTSDIHTKIRSAAKTFGEDGQIDILVYSAGVHGGMRFEAITEDEYDAVLGINLKGMFFVCQEVASYMKENGINGHILNVGSASALKPAGTPYEISKWGVRGFTLGLSRELIKYGITVNCIAPGPVATSMLNYQEEKGIAMPSNPSKRMAVPEEIGNLAVFMVSDAGKLIVGDSYYISGGSGTILIDT